MHRSRIGAGGGIGLIDEAGSEEKTVANTEEEAIIQSALDIFQGRIVE